jgi:hypothetical protein
LVTDRWDDDFDADGLEGVGEDARADSTGRGDEADRPRDATVSSMRLRRGRGERGAIRG